MKRNEYVIPLDYSDKSVFDFLKNKAELSNKILGTLRHTDGAVTLNGAPARMIDKLNENDKLVISLPEKTQPPLLWNYPLEIIFENDDLLVINKPSGISVHPTYKHPNETLCNAVAFYLTKKSGEPSVARAVGRLDKVTSGVMIFAKNKIAASRLNGNLDKTYLAIASGVTRECGTINVPIYRPDETKTLRAAGKGDEAITHYKAVGHFPDKTLLEIKTQTGRTHQIRVHLSYIGHPLAGDEMYGGATTSSLKRAALHCSEIRLRNPLTNEEFCFRAPLPDDMKKELEKI